MPASSASRGVPVLTIGRPSHNTWPSASSRPPSARSASRWPLPSAPAKPRISPRRTSKARSVKARAAQSLRPRARCSVDAVVGSRRIFRLDRPADHQRDQIVLRQRLVDLVGALADAVAEDGDAVGERQDLRQPVADIDDRRARGDDPADDAAQLLDAGKVEARGRLVEQQHLRVRGQRLDDFEELALRGVRLPTSASGEMPRS